MAKIVIDSASVSIVVDVDLQRPIGTGFFFLRSDLFVTAKHVVVDHGQPRGNLVLMQPGNPKATVHFTHPDRDLALLKVPFSSCKVPLYPGHVDFAALEGFYCCGYSRQSSDVTGGAFFVVPTHVYQYQHEKRERDAGVEELVIFEAPYSKAGYSGGPLVGAGGTVVGVVIESNESDGKSVVRGTTIQALLDFVEFPNSFANSAV